VINTIEKNVKQLIRELPQDVKIVAAAKTKTAQEVLKSVEAGIEIIGENYVKDAKNVYEEIKGKAELHFIGIPDEAKHDLLRRKNLLMFDMIETINSMDIAEAINKKCTQIGKLMPVLIEINSGEEVQKSGVLPEDTVELVEKICKLSNIKVMGLMTMGSTPHQSMEDPKDRERARACFKTTKKLFDELKKIDLPGVEMKYLSMGMSNSYMIALEEGANLLRIGSKIYGERK
jgi:PLP dependent protein